MIQFVTRASMQVNNRAVEVQKGLPEDYSVSSSPSVLFNFFFFPILLDSSVEQSNTINKTAKPNGSVGGVTLRVCSSGVSVTWFAVLVSVTAGS